jgi:hypothetical protein
MLSIIDLDQDILITHGLSQVKPIELTNFLLSSKTFYANRRDYLNANEYTKKFAVYDDTQDYFSVIVNSHIMPTSDITMYFPTDCAIDDAKVRNTARIVQFHHYIKDNNEAAFRQYMLDLLHYQYGYAKNSANEVKIDAFFEEMWWKSNINPYDIYQIIYHMSHIKYRAVADCLERLTFINNDFCHSTLNTILSTMIGATNSQTRENIELKIILIYVIYSYIEKIIDKISTKDYTILIVELAKRIRDAQCYIAETKSFPQYLKTILATKLYNTRNLIEDRLNKMLTES